MLHIVTSENQELYSEQLEQSYKIRHEIYVGERGWKDIERPDKREIDQFDNENTINLLVLDDEQNVIGGSRLMPTVCPTLMSDVFPELASFKPLPKSERIFEWTRYYVVPEKRETNYISETASIILCGVQEYCLSEGIEKLSIVTEPFWIARFYGLGWNPKPLGLPINIDKEPIVGITVDVSHEALTRSRSIKGIEDSVIVKREIYTSQVYNSQIINQKLNSTMH